jgi:RNA polymerase sigma-70 factor (ECF subfamily)
MVKIADLWREHHATLRRFVGRRVADPHDADDIVQDVFVRAQESLHRLESADRAPAWLARIAANRVIDHYRARRPTEELPEDLAAEAPEDDAVAALAPCLPEMIERLPDRYREALRLSEIEGIAQREVAQRLALSVSGAKSRVQRGRALLRQIVERCCRVVMAGRTIVDLERIVGRCACAPRAATLRPS